MMQIFKPKPSTPQERKALHEKLVLFAEKANARKSTQAISLFLRSYGDVQFVWQIIRWFEKYTSVRLDTSSDNLTFVVPYNLYRKFDLSGARLNPYWTIESIAPEKKSFISIGKSNESTSGELSEREFKKKIIRLALSEYLDTETIEAKNKLLKLINDFPEKCESPKGSLFVQGGAPGLGKNR